VFFVILVVVYIYKGGHHHHIHRSGVPPWGALPCAFAIFGRILAAFGHTWSHLVTQMLTHTHGARARVDVCVCVCVYILQKIWGAGRQKKFFFGAPHPTILVQKWWDAGSSDLGRHVKQPVGYLKNQFLIISRRGLAIFCLVYVFQRRTLGELILTKKSKNR